MSPRLTTSHSLCLALVRGDHQVHETKLADSLAATAVRTAHPEEIRELLGAGAGSLGGVGARGRAKEANFDLLIVADLALKDRRNMTTGANKDDHHLRGVEVERDIKPDKWADLRGVVSGEACPRCEQGTLEVYKAMEIGHIFKLGTKVFRVDGRNRADGRRQAGSDRYGQLRHRS